MRQSVKKLSDSERKKIGKKLAASYAKGRSIREIASDQGYSYGFVHSNLQRAGVTLRGRGGRVATRR